MKEITLIKGLRILLLILICLMCIIPFYVLLVLSLNAPSRVFYEGNLFIPTFAWSNFADAWKKAALGRLWSTPL